MNFEALFACSPNPYVVLDPDLVIVWMNDAYLRSTMRTRAEILNRSMFDAFPSDPHSESYRLLKSSFDRVLETGEADELALIRYDIPRPDGSMDQRSWSATNSPILGPDGKVTFILQHTVDVTELLALRRLRDEMGIVQRADALQARNRDLRAETERLRSLLEKAPGFVAVLSGPEHRTVMTNEAYRNLVGQRDLTGRPVAAALPEIVDQGFVDLLTKVHQTAVPHVAKRELVRLNNGPSGQAQERFLDFVFQPIFVEGGGRVSGVFVQGHDVTEQVEAEEHQKLLMNELNHRVKNILAIVQSLAAQSFRNSVSPDGGLSAFTARLAALSNAHSLLTQRNWEAAGLAEILRSGVEATAGIDIERVRFAGPDISLHPQAATSVAMVVHELSTNAIKHGALSRPDGRVDISWEAESLAGGRRLSLCWKESGGPEVAEPQKRGFGTRLIERGISANARSSVDLDYHPSGLCCSIVAEIASAA